MMNEKKAFRGDMPNGFNPAMLDTLSEQTKSHVQRRIRLLAPGYRLFYNEPVQVSSGKGTKLFDAAGNDYLDAYNNVVSVGHCHPRVVAALTKQANILCTHTRYMQEGILAYAEDLLSTFNTEIATDGQLMFTCSGSEANDLAFRIARHYTGGTGIICTQEAYHGNSATVAGFSPSLGMNSNLGEFVRTVPAPDSYRGDPAQLGAWMAKNVADQIADIKRHGGKFSAFIVDSLFSSDGIFSHPTDVLNQVADVVKNAGGLFIADEVQSGFGRSGTHFWGHERHGVVPDIVTMGKPMGNGYPVAAVLINKKVVENFGKQMRYFNTFGGNSVAIATAHETLNVIRDEGLLQNAVDVGSMIMDGVKELAQKYEQIGDVRGSGLYFGIELVKDRETKATDMVSALSIVNSLREQRILISATGPDASILKIRPPLVFSRADAERLLTGLSVALSQL